MGKYVLYVTKNCGTCERVKNLIKNQKILSFPVLADTELKVLAHGTAAGYYIAENTAKF